MESPGRSAVIGLLCLTALASTGGYIRAAPASDLSGELSFRICQQYPASLESLVNADLNSDIQAEKRESVPISREIQAEARRTTVLFVTGFTGDWAPEGTYFKTMMTVAQSMGMKVEIIKPSSRQSILQNAREHVSAKIRELYANRRPGEQLILFGHSMGGPTVALASALNPDLLENHYIAKTFSLQGAHGGVPEIDGLINLCRNPFFAVTPICNRAMIDGLLSMAANRPNDELESAAKGLTPKQFTALYNSILQLPTVIDSRRAPFHLTRAQIASIEQRHGPNDGVLVTDRQRHPRFGRILGREPLAGLDHFGAVAPWPLGEASAYQEALGRAIFKRLLKIIHEERALDSPAH